MQDITSFIDVKTRLPIPGAVITSLINRQLGEVQIGARLRVVDSQLRRQHVCDKPASWDDEINGTFDSSDISYWVSPDATLKHDTTTPVHKVINFTMINPNVVPGSVTYNPNASAPLTPGFPFNPEFNFIEVAQWMRAAGVEFEVPLGFYIMFVPTASYKPGSTFFTWQGLDLSSLVSQTPFISDYVVYKDYPGGYVGAITDMLTSGAIPITKGGTGITPTGNADAGPAIPPAFIRIPTTYNPDVPVDILFQAGTNRLEAINQLLQAINYYPLWVRTRNNPSIWDATRNGYALEVLFTTSAMPFFKDGIPQVGWDYSTLPSSSILESPINQDFTSQANTQICNFVRVEGASNQAKDALGNPIQYVTELLNDNPNSVISTDNLKNLDGGPRIIAKYEKNDKLANQAMCDLRAQILLQQGAMLPEQLQVTGLHHPLHEDHDVLVMQVTNKTGTVLIPSSANSPFIETSWELPLKAAAGRMSHTASRIVAI